MGGVLADEGAFLPKVMSGLPRTQTKSGVSFDSSQDIWSYRDGVNNVSLDFNQLMSARALIESIKKVLSWYAQHHSPAHLKNMFQRLKHFFRTIEQDHVSSITALC